MMMMQTPGPRTRLVPQELLDHPFLHPVAAPAVAPSSGRGLSREEASQLMQVNRPSHKPLWPIRMVQAPSVWTS